MPPRFAYWTILAGGLPTAFRAAEREDLLATFHRLRERQPDAELKYFARGKLWSSREAAEEARERTRTGPSGAARGRDWRPGGEHRDPRQQFRDEQRAKNQAKRQDRWDRKHAKTASSSGEGARAGAPYGRPPGTAPREGFKPGADGRPRIPSGPRESREPRAQARPDNKAFKPAKGSWSGTRPDRPAGAPQGRSGFKPGADGPPRIPSGPRESREPRGPARPDNKAFKPAKSAWGDKRGGRPPGAPQGRSGFKPGADGPPRRIPSGPRESREPRGPARPDNKAFKPAKGSWGDKRGGRPPGAPQGRSGFKPGGRGGRGTPGRGGR